MPQIPNIPDHLIGRPGVEMVPPPIELMPQTMGVIEAAVANVAKDETMLLTVWIDTTKGVNVAYVQKLGDQFEVVGWVGKKGKWGEPIEAGVAARWHR